jgi:hypothetical protein
VRPSLLTFVLCGGGLPGIEGVVAIEDLVHEAHGRAAASSRRLAPPRAAASPGEPPRARFSVRRRKNVERMKSGTISSPS